MADAGAHAPGVKPATTARAERPFVSGALGRLLGGLYAREVERRNRRFDAGRGVVTLDRPVISVGNLSLGGTGKTPMVQRIVRLLRAQGHDPCIAMRGYGSKRGGDGRSDEAELYRREFEDLPVVAQPKRVEGLIELFAGERGARVDCIVLDDGFQHRRIARQLDLVLVDASQDPFDGAVFPAGRLREPARNLARATHLCITHAELAAAAAVERLRERLLGVAPHASCAVAAHRWAGVTVVEGASSRDEPVAWLRGRRVVAACAIGRPAAFLAGLERAGAQVLDSFVLRDHDPFRPATVERLTRGAEAAGADAIVMTDKDWTKVGARPEIRWPAVVARPRLEMEFRSGLEDLETDALSIAVSKPA